MIISHYYRPAPPLPASVVATLSASISGSLSSVTRETCFNVEHGELTSESRRRVEWLISETFDKASTKLSSPALASSGDTTVVEFGPRLTFCTAFSSNACEIFKQCGITTVTRFEKSIRYGFIGSLEGGDLDALKAQLHDRMTEMEYEKPIESFDAGVSPEPVTTVPIMRDGRAALEKINSEKGLGFDEWDLDYYTDLFINKLGRDPTDVECFDMGQSNSEHSRHWFFGGKMIIDGEEKSETLFRMVKDTLKTSNKNSVIAFHDNSSAIRGYENVPYMRSSDPSGPSKMEIENITLHPILTAETHNFPCGVAPFPGAETGTGGRLRDVMATGRGANSVAGISSYCVGNLNIPDYDLPWEDKSFDYPSNLASPLEIEVEASNGASDYGNKYGEPVINGFTRSFGQRLPNGERFEWVKPIMFSAGIGSMDGRHTVKGSPEKGMLVVKIGGPAYRIGVGGGAASSRVQDAANADLDFDAVQRGDAEMENRMNRLMRACIELGDKNPIVSVHDQGAGGNGNVLKEIVEPAGAEYDIRKVYVGDETMSVMEIFGAEYQENNALLINKEDKELFGALADRENCPYRILGEVTGDGKVVVKDSSNGTTPVDLPLELVLGDLPPKTFTDSHIPGDAFKPFVFPSDATVATALDRVLRNLAVGSKRFLVHKVDRSVTGLIAQQPCVGPLQIPLANNGVVAHSHFGTTGTVVAVGEQPIKGLVNAAAMARMVVAESLTNIMWAKISAIEDIKASGNWMYAAKLAGEGAKMWDACVALKDALVSLGVGIDGGKDSLSMAAKVGDEVVKAPGELSLTCYVTCPNIRLSVTPDLKADSSSRLLFVPCGDQSKARLGGTILAQCYNQVGNETPDVEDFATLKNAVIVTQELLADSKILAGHDRSDGGLIVTLLEMAFAGNCGLDVDVPDTAGEGGVSCLFNEEAGFVMQVKGDDVESVIEAFKAKNVPCLNIGTVTTSAVSINVDGKSEVKSSVQELRDVWEETSFQLEKRQRDPALVKLEQDGLKSRKTPEWKLTYQVKPTVETFMMSASKPKVAILRQEGTNGDREMSAAFMSAGFDAWDVNVKDLLDGKVLLKDFKGIVACGGFSYADTLDSAKGWGGVIKFNEGLKRQFEEFRRREDTFGLGICNGCQLFALMGWVPSSGDVLEEERQPRLVHNDSGRFESRFSSVKIGDSPSVFFKGMEGSSLGVWVAHGEGKFYFPDDKVYEDVVAKNLVAVKYCDDSNEPTSEYPFCPNGSRDGIAAMSSDDGRFLAMMPHPERCFLSWQWPWMPEEWEKDKSGADVSGPWLKMFQNAREFCG
jgi:phosphoribosylformylglycinamidine synthase